ncbi:hypothetical protein QZM52_34100 [Burkholderia metallica]|uniref:Uncharacterized protein n=1 Tax=Burkholderia metallica TaxID=488729 RepID=A0ABT8PMD2_9BURK|nr:hypothetical protein [Burkholderia metallica]MDN7936313.1 hypothetical protein [Burkholderia metallica]
MTFARMRPLIIGRYIPDFQVIRARESHCPQGARPGGIAPDKAEAPDSSVQAIFSST